MDQMSNDKRISPKPSVARVLYARAGGRCSLCKKRITKDSKETEVIIIAAIAHISAVKKGKARYNDKLSPEQRRAYSNLIILCNNCHKEVDEDVAKYDIDKMVLIKKDHEDWVDLKLEEGIPSITFKELAEVTSFLLSEPLGYEEHMVVVPPPEKIAKNNLSNSVAKLITIGFVQSSLVGKYINECVTDDFYEKLKSGFVQKYLELKEDGLKGDSLFHELHNFASGGSPNTIFRAAGLSILTYFFEICEVFEK